MKRFLFLSIVLTSIIACQTNNDNSEFDFGKTSGSIYVNNFFKFSLPIPEDWNIVSDDQMKMRLNSPAIMFRDTILHRKASEISSAYLFSISKYPLDSINLGFNLNIMLMAERLNTITQILTAKQYLESVKKQLTNTAQQYVFDALSEIKLGKRTFSVMSVHCMVRDITVYQKYFAIKIDNFCLVLISTYDSPESDAAIQKILSKIDFKK